jgi:hypothetical protein
MFGSEFIQLSEDTKEEHSIERNEVRVYLKTNSDWHGPKLYVVVTIPNDGTAKCQYKKVVNEYTTLVCEK